MHSKLVESSTVSRVHYFFIMHKTSDQIILTDSKDVIHPTNIFFHLSSHDIIPDFSITDVAAFENFQDRSN